MSMTLAEKAPTSTLDPYTDQALLNPWPLYRELREMGPVVWLEKHGMFALTRYDVVVKALRDWEAFPWSFGVMMNDDMNQILRGNTLCSDGDAHHPIAPCGNPADYAGRAHIAYGRGGMRGRSGRRPAVRQGTILRDPRARNPSAGDDRLQRNRSSGGRTRADDGVEYWPVQLHRPDERSRTQRYAGALRNDALCPHPCRPGQAEGRKLGRGDSSCRRRRRGAVRGSAGPDDRLYGAQPRHDDLGRLQRRVVVRQLP